MTKGFSFHVAGRKHRSAVRAQRSAAHALAFFVATGGADTSTCFLSLRFLGVNDIARL